MYLRFLRKCLEIMLYVRLVETLYVFNAKRTGHFTSTRTLISKGCLPRVSVTIRNSKNAVNFRTPAAIHNLNVTLCLCYVRSSKLRRRRIDRNVRGKKKKRGGEKKGEEKERNKGSVSAKNIHRFINLKRMYNYIVRCIVNMVS